MATAPSAARIGKRREEGTVLVRFAIDGGGNVLSTGVVRSSGHAELDQAVLTLVRRASPGRSVPCDCRSDHRSACARSAT